MLLGDAMRQFHAAVWEYVREHGMLLHYVTAREMVNVVRAAEDGAAGNPGEYRNYWLPPPSRVRAAASVPTRSTSAVPG